MSIFANMGSPTAYFCQIYLFTLISEYVVLLTLKRSASSEEGEGQEWKGEDGGGVCARMYTHTHTHIYIYN